MSKELSKGSDFNTHVEPVFPTAAVLIDSISGDDKEYSPTAGRFDLANEPDTHDIVLHTQGELINRFLVTPTDTEVDYTETVLRLGNIPILERTDLLSLEGCISYEIPFQTKPLANEKFFPGRPSTETYVSDTEIFTEFGNLWSRIYQQTGKLPPDNPMQHTGMTEFTSKNGKLFPLPPYRWSVIQKISAKSHLINILEDELYQQNPSDLDDGVDRTLINAAISGWQE